jgi:hypothetical protein
MATNLSTPTYDFQKTKLHPKKYHLPILWFFLLLFSWWMFENPPVSVLAQEPTPTVSLSQPANEGMFITVSPATEDHANVRSGPNSVIYPIIGIMPVGATAPALGRSQGGDWVQIAFPYAGGDKGWMYIANITVSPGTLPIVEPPPTPVPPPTATIDPTLAAQFNNVPTSTRLPTFTPAPALDPPEFTPAQPSQFNVPFAPGAAILAMGIVGTLGLLYSFLQRN